jgi:hypothetical protein
VLAHTPPAATSSTRGVRPVLPADLVRVGCRLAPVHLPQAPARRASSTNISALPVAVVLLPRGAATVVVCSLYLGHLARARAHLRQPGHRTQSPPSPCGSIGGRRAKQPRAAMRASARAHRRWLPSWGLGALALGAGIMTPGTGRCCDRPDHRQAGTAVRYAVCSTLSNCGPNRQL